MAANHLLGALGLAGAALTTVCAVGGVYGAVKGGSERARWGLYETLKGAAFGAAMGAVIAPIVVFDAMMPPPRPRG